MRRGSSGGNTPGEEDEPLGAQASRQEEEEKASNWERWRLAGILRRGASTVSGRPRHRVGPWERRRLAGIFSAFQALFFFVDRTRLDQ